MTPFFSCSGDSSALSSGAECDGAVESVAVREVVEPVQLGLVDRQQVDLAGTDQIEEGGGTETFRGAVGDPRGTVLYRLPGGG